MPIPDYQDFMLPLLQAVSDGKDHHIRDVTTLLADSLGLSQEQRHQLLPSGQQSVVANRVAWAKTYLKKAGLLDSPKRGYIRISGSGCKALATHPTKIDNDFLKKYASFVDFYGRPGPRRAVLRKRPFFPRPRMKCWSLPTSIFAVPWLTIYWSRLRVVPRSFSSDWSWNCW